MVVEIIIIYRSVYVHTLTYGHGLWLMIERTRSQIHGTKMKSFSREAGHTLRNKVKSSATQEELEVELLLLHIK